MTIFEDVRTQSDYTDKNFTINTDIKTQKRASEIMTLNRLF